MKNFEHFLRPAPAAQLSNVQATRITFPIRIIDSTIFVNGLCDGFPLRNFDQIAIEYFSEKVKTIDVGSNLITTGVVRVSLYTLMPNETFDYDGSVHYACKDYSHEQITDGRLDHEVVDDKVLLYYDRRYWE